MRDRRLIGTQAFASARGLQSSATLDRKPAPVLSSAGARTWAVGPSRSSSDSQRRARNGALPVPEISAKAESRLANRRPPSASTLANGLAIEFPRPFPESGTAGQASSRVPLEKAKRALATRTSIYIVDDEEGLAELYTLFLEGTGYHVRAFTHRLQALTALRTRENKPDLLILDYMGHPPPVEQFMAQCRALQPAVRFLMASGLNEFEMQFYAAKPDHFLQKPFTAEEFLRAVKTALDS